jgi:hypothetical protein
MNSRQRRLHGDMIVPDPAGHDALMFFRSVIAVVGDRDQRAGTGQLDVGSDKWAGMPLGQDWFVRHGCRR